MVPAKLKTLDKLSQIPPLKRTIQRGAGNCQAYYRLLMISYSLLLIFKSEFGFAVDPSLSPGLRVMILLRDATYRQSDRENEAMLMLKSIFHEYNKTSCTTETAY